MSESSKLAQIRELCHSGDYTTWDQEKHLGDHPWLDVEACTAWESAHGHDVRLKCYPEFGCQLLIDPEDVLAILDARD